MLQRDLSQLLMIKWKGVMGKFFEVLAMLVAMVMVGAVVRGCMSSTDGVGQSSQPTSSQIVYAVSDEVNKKLPLFIDSETRLDKVVPSHGGSRMTYSYTLVNRRSSDVDRSAFRSTVFPGVKVGVCTSPDMARIRELGVTVDYAYSGYDGVEVARLSVAPSECSG